MELSSLMSAMGQIIEVEKEILAALEPRIRAHVEESHKDFDRLSVEHHLDAVAQEMHREIRRISSFVVGICDHA